MNNTIFYRCAVFYLDQWVKRDEKYYSALQGIDQSVKLEAIKKAAGFYGVARNFKKKYDEEIKIKRLQPALEIIDVAKKSDFSSNTVGEILKYKEKLQEKYKQNVLSATTKFLWLKIRDPIIIYDSFARNTLGTKEKDLHDYYAKWNDEFNIHKKDIEISCLKLSKINYPGISKKYIKEVASKTWFKKRVFDTYLWAEGGGKAQIPVNIIKINPLIYLLLELDQ